MSLKTPDSRLQELGLTRFSVVYDDEENEPSAIAWLYLASDGSGLGHWNNELKYFPLVVPENFKELYHLTAIVEECRARAGFQSSDYDNTLRQMRADSLWTEAKSFSLSNVNDTRIPGTT